MGRIDYVRPAGPREVPRWWEMWLWRHASRDGILVFALAFGISFAVYVVPPALRGVLDDPPLGLDQTAYDNLGVQVSKGRWFTTDHTDPDFLRPYERDNEDGRYDHLRAKGGPAPDLKWPPLYPTVLGASQSLFGRSFWSTRIVNSALMAITCAICALLAFRRAGWAGALIAIVAFCMLDVRTRDYARYLMSEALSGFLIAVLVYLLVRISTDPKRRYMLLAGIVLGLAGLTRTTFILWSLPLAVLLYWMTAGSGRQRAPGVILFGLGFAVLVVPYFAYNSTKLDAFMPLGPHTYTLPSGYSDEAYRRGGLWYSLGESYFQEVDSPDDSPMERARKRAQYGRDKALGWALENPGKVVALMAAKAFNLWVPSREFGILALLFPLIGLWALKGSRELAIYALVLSVNTACVAMTWNFNDDRFQVPVLSVIHVLTAIGVWTVLATLWKGRDVEPERRSRGDIR